MRRKLVRRPLGTRGLEGVHRALIDDAERLLAAHGPTGKSACPHGALFPADRVDLLSR
jgi:hypothetical protein